MYKLQSCSPFCMFPHCLHRTWGQLDFRALHAYVLSSHIRRPCRSLFVRSRTCTPVLHAGMHAPCRLYQRYDFQRRGVINYKEFLHRLGFSVDRHSRPDGECTARRTREGMHEGMHECTHECTHERMHERTNASTKGG